MCSTPFSPSCSLSPLCRDLATLSIFNHFVKILLLCQYFTTLSGSCFSPLCPYLATRRHFVKILLLIGSSPPPTSSTHKPILLKAAMHSSLHLSVLQRNLSAQSCTYPRCNSSSPDHLHLYALHKLLLASSGQGKCREGEESKSLLRGSGQIEREEMRL